MVYSIRVKTLFVTKQNRMNINKNAVAIIKFCREIKALATQSKDFDEFYKKCHSIKNVPLKKDEFARLISVASVEANLA